MKRVFVLLLVLLLITVSGVGCSPSSQSTIKSDREAYWSYIKYRQLEKVWDTLHPDSQATFESKSAFVEDKTNNLLQIVSWTIDNVQIIPNWTFSAQNTSYTNVAEIQETIIYSTALGRSRHSGIVHAVQVNRQWKFFHSPAE